MLNDDDDHWEPTVAHDCGRLDEWGIYVCDCTRCAEVWDKNRKVMLLVRGGKSRFIIEARDIRSVDDIAEALDDYVRDVSVASRHWNLACCEWLPRPKLPVELDPCRECRLSAASRSRCTTAITIVPTSTLDTRSTTRQSGSLRAS